MRAGVGLVVGAALIIQFGAAFASTLFDDLGAGGTVFLRLAFAALVLMAVWRPALRGRSSADLRLVALFGVALGLMNWTFYEAIERIPLGLAVTFEMVGPLGVAVAGSRRALDGVWIALAGCGVLLLARPWEGGGDLDPVGIALALFAGGCWGAYILLSARTGRAFSGGQGLAIAMVVGAVVTLPAGVVQGEGALLKPELLAAGLAVALASSVVPYSLELEALRRIPEAVFGVMMSLEPALAALAGLLVLDQTLSLGEVLAMVLVVAASAGAAATHQRQAPIVEA